MEKDKILGLKEQFEQALHQVEDIEFWFARELQLLLGYAKWQKFVNVIEKARESCENSGENADDHFTHAGKMIETGKGAQREIEDLMLTRYACYLIAQNGDPRKEEIAFAQSYFAVQTRKYELIEERMLLNERMKARKKLVQSEKELSELLYQRGVDQQGFARIRSRGDQVLFGGNSTMKMKLRLKVPGRRALADFLPEVTIKAKDLATSITNFNVKHRDLYGERPITDQHISSNKTVREALLKEGIRPEDLPPEEDIKKLQRRVNSADKKLKGLKKKSDSRGQKSDD